MKLNKKLYDTILGEPYEVQTLDNGKVINIYSMNNHNYFDYYARRRREFAVFSSLDGKNYKLLIEDGYYEVLHDLYDSKINGIWEEYVTTANKSKNNFLIKITIPVLAIYLIISMVILAFSNNNMFVFLGLILILFVTNGVLKNMQIKRIYKINVDSTNKIKEEIGALRFEELLKAQEEYVNKFLGIEEVVENKEIEEDDSFEEERPTNEEEEGNKDE